MWGGLSRWHSGKVSVCQCRRHKRLRFESWVRKIPWSKKWQLTPAFSPGESHGQRSLAGYSPWGHKELDMTEEAIVNHELPDVQAGFRKGRGTRDQIANICWIIGKAREFQKNIYFCFIDYAKAFDCVDHNKLWKILKEMGIQTTWPATWEICMQVRKQQLELDMQQQTGSK